MKAGSPSAGPRRTDRIRARFTALRAEGRAALIPFVTAGDPFPDATVTLLHALVAAGADLIELGMPFSDPMADGPVIQHADERALQHHVGLDMVLGWVRAFRADDTTTPIVLMGYLNPIAVHGIERFGQEAASAGVDGVLAVDCPIEEDDVLQPLRAAGLKRVLLVAPTTSDARLARALQLAEGYLYYVSFAGITGAARLSVAGIAERVGGLRQRSPVPVAVGFGIKDPASAKAVAGFADAVVIGSALVDRLARATTVDEVASAARAFLAPVRAALAGR